MKFLYKKLVVLAVLLLSFFLHMSAYAWSSSGHRVIAAIAYQHLDDQAKTKVDQITQVMFHSKSGWVRFLLAATWPDMIKQDDVTAFNSWHYIDYPYSADGTTTKSINKQNVAWAIQQSLKVVANPKATLQEKAWHLNFLVHFVGDAHQPLHCISRYSKTFPKGDRGGNLFLIHSRSGKNLHQYWDLGGGLLKMRHRSRFRKSEQLATMITNQYPTWYFAKRLKNLDPWLWTKEGYQLAIQAVYQIQPNSTPDKTYAKMTQKRVKQQLALAGYRLAILLNSAFSQGGTP